jgi:hypothetical protein
LKFCFARTTNGLIWDKFFIDARETIFMGDGDENKFEAVSFVVQRFYPRFKIKSLAVEIN